ncbi:hypothetical protein D5S17_02090 [Pseudonocardiaceae bacterium YIM PH 21723]|nr:hypothetical protein D5S17_02090 [Pseudonocardiaceae bacterium YIM PH 21723]
MGAGQSRPSCRRTFVRSFRALLSVVLLLGFFLLAIGLIAGTAALAYWIVISDWDGPVAVLVLVAGFLTVGLVSAVVSALRAREVPDGLLLVPGEHPELFRLINEVSSASGVTAPDEVWLVGEPSASVLERGRFLGLLPGNRLLLIGVPYLLGFPLPEFRAVLAHEFGHFAGEHTVLDRVTMRGVAAMQGVLEKLQGRIAALPLVWWAYLYLAVAGDLSRRQELEADRFSARFAGAEVAGSALRHAPTAAGRVP